MYRINVSSPVPPPFKEATSEPLPAELRAVALARAGWGFQERNEVQPALDHYKQALALVEASDPRQHWRVVVPVKNNMATLLRAHGRHREAEACYVQAINLMEACGMAADSALADIFSNLAALYHAVRMPEAAMRMQERCVDLLAADKDADPAVKAKATKTLAKLCKQCGQAERAEDLVRQAAELAV